MALSLSDFANLFYRLLPPGDLWPTQDLTSASWHNYIRAMVAESQRVAAAADAWLADWWPDETTQQLEDWERVLSLPQALARQGLQVSDLTTAQRRALVVASRRQGPQTVAELEAMAAPLGYTATVVQPLRRARTAGVLSGESCGQGWPHTFGYCYMANVVPNPIDFTSGWTHGGSTTVTADHARAPDGTLTADRVVHTGASSVARRSTYLTGLSSRLDVSVWLRSDTPQGFPIEVSAAGIGAGAIVADRWTRVQVRNATNASFITISTTPSTTRTFWVWGAFAGQYDPLLETYLARATPAHTYAQPRCVGDTQNYNFTYP